MYYKPHYNHYNHPAQPKLPTINNPITASHPQLSSRHHSLSPNTRKRRTVNNQPAPSSTSNNTLSSSPDHIYTHTTLVYLTHGNRYTHTHTARKRGPRASLPFSSSRFLKSGAGGGGIRFPEGARLVAVSHRRRMYGTKPGPITMTMAYGPWENEGPARACALDFWKSTRECVCGYGRG